MQHVAQLAQDINDMFQSAPALEDGRCLRALMGRLIPLLFQSAPALEDGRCGVKQRDAVEG